MIETNNESNLVNNVPAEQPAQNEDVSHNQEIDSAAASSVEAKPEPTKGKVYVQDDIDKVVVAEKRKAYERGLRDAAMKQQDTSANSNESILNSDVVTQKIRDEIANIARQAQEMQTYNSFINKVKDEAGKNNEFAESIKLLEENGIPMGKLPANWIPGLSSVEFAAEALAEMVKKDPGNIPKLIFDAQYYGNEYALSKISSVADSIKKNKEAAKKKLPNEPLSQMSSSNVGTGDGTMSLKDYKKADWLRG